MIHKTAWNLRCYTADDVMEVNVARSGSVISMGSLMVQTTYATKCALFQFNIDGENGWYNNVWRGMGSVGGHTLGSDNSVGVDTWDLPTIGDGFHRHLLTPPSPPHRHIRHRRRHCRLRCRVCRLRRPHPRHHPRRPHRSCHLGRLRRRICMTLTADTH